MRAADQVAELVLLGIGGVLARRQLPTPRRNDRIRNIHRADRAVHEPQKDSGGVLNRVASTGVRLHDLHRDDLATEISKKIDVVDEIREDRPRAFFTTPGGVEIVFRLHHPKCAMNGDDFP